MAHSKLKIFDIGLICYSLEQFEEERTRSFILLYFGYMVKATLICINIC